MVIGFFVILVLGNLVNSQNETDFIDKLPDKEKADLLKTIARRVSDEVKVTNKSDAPVLEIDNAQMDQFDDYVKKIVQEEKENLRKNANDTDKTKENTITLKIQPVVIQPLPSDLSKKSNVSNENDSKIYTIPIEPLKIKEEPKNVITKEPTTVTIKTTTTRTTNNKVSEITTLKLDSKNDSERTAKEENPSSTKEGESTTTTEFTIASKIKDSIEVTKSRLDKSNDHSNSEEKPINVLDRAVTYQDVQIASTTEPADSTLGESHESLKIMQRLSDPIYLEGKPDNVVFPSDIFPVNYELKPSPSLNSAISPLAPDDSISKKALLFALIKGINALIAADEAKSTKGTNPNAVKYTSYEDDKYKNLQDTSKPANLELYNGHYFNIPETPNDVERKPATRCKHRGDDDSSDGDCMSSEENEASDSAEMLSKKEDTKKIPRILSLILLLSKPSTGDKKVTFDDVVYKELLSPTLNTIQNDKKMAQALISEKQKWSHVIKKDGAKLNCPMRHDIGVHIRALQNLILKDDEGLHRFDWLGSTVDIQAAMQKLLMLSDQMLKGLKVHSADVQLLRFLIYLHKLSEQKIKEGEACRLKNSNLSKNHKFEYMQKADWVANRKPKAKMNKELYEYYNNDEEDGSEDITEFVNFLNIVQTSLYDLHTVIKKIAQITKYNKQNWFDDIRNLYLSYATKEDFIGVLLHLNLVKIIDSVENSSSKGLTDDYVKYIASHQDEILKISNEFYFCSELLHEIQQSF